MEKSRQLLILYATETGNALDAAERIGREAERRGCPVRIVSLDEFDPSSLPSEKIVIFVVSTTGQGDTPNPMKAFWTYLLQRSLTRQWLENTDYAVFGLGDSGYQKYNFVAKKLDKRLADLGGTSIIERGLGDDQHPSGYEGALDPWMSSLWSVLYNENRQLFPKGLDISASDTRMLDQPKLHITYLDLDEVHLKSPAGIDDSLENGERALNIPIKLRRFVELTMDIASASPRRYFFEVMSFFATAEHEKERLQYFASPEGRDDLYQYNQKERRTVLEVLEDFPSVNMPFEWLVQLTPPLKTRAFSISSSPLVHPNQVHLTVSIVSWTTPFKRKRTGLCSNWLASLDPHQRVCIPAWFHKGSLPAPAPSLPLILIGPGTGCAPFRGFVEERALEASKSIPTSPILFFFGCRNEQNDFLYKDFWISHSQNGGVLSEEKGGGFYVAFSRDQPHKVYVQHKMKEQCVKIWDLLSKGAAVYVAGSSNNMPADVLAAFEEIVATEGGVSREDAVRWLRTLEKGGKYHVEAWA
ncbi:NADPH-dependent diflavin oxidoreductase 1 [Artemisia annua]|uniref:NADPH-dependent diflavin oxidoreductase 1 n=1 Tax=Artemisia annua TaxID=35608 RepID=A0A2U1MXY0_ARTAN|nr:NADPH-dependent diflavin oxidoreductase 1 [Artemisia annua]